MLLGNNIKKLMTFIGSMRFAIFIIALFALLLVIGSLVEVKYGHIVADYYIYDSFFFGIVVFLIILSLLFSMLLRPFKKKFYGFFLIHIGLIILAIGALQSKLTSVEGLMQMYPLKSVSKIQLAEFQLQIHEKTKDSIIVDLPKLIDGHWLNKPVGALNLKQYIPFSKEEKLISDSKGHYVINVELYNDKLHEEMTFTSDFASSFYQESKNLGPLEMITFSASIDKCIQESGYILIDTKSNLCAHYPSKKDKVFKIKYNKASLRFAPEFSQSPITQAGAEILDSQYRLLSLDRLKKKPSVWLNQTTAYYFDKKIIEDHREVIALPWMGFELSFSRYKDKTLKKVYVDSKDYSRFKPAISFDYKGEIYWVNLNDSAFLDKTYLVQLKKKSIPLPFAITLLDFKREQDFGTNQDSFYQSTVQFQERERSYKSEITLNNPLKDGLFTIYQESFKKLVGGKYLSVLKVNVDSGRSLKYFGWFIALLGMIIHFSLRRIRL